MKEQKNFLHEPAADFDDSMLVFAGFSNQRLNEFLAQLSKHKVPRIDLKAVLTEHNAVWDSITLHDELVSEHALMNPTEREQR